MIVLDTNVISEPLKPKPDASVQAWLDRQEPQTLYLTAITVAELRAGIEAMPAGRRRKDLEVALVDQILPLFDGRILSFDQDVAEAFARIRASARKVGNTISFADAAIAAITVMHGFTLATRNTADFKGAGVKLLDPWKMGH